MIQIFALYVIGHKICAIHNNSSPRLVTCVFFRNLTTDSGPECVYNVGVYLRLHDSDIELKITQCSGLGVHIYNVYYTYLGVQKYRESARGVIIDVPKIVRKLKIRQS